MEARAIISVIDNLDSTSITDALSANQGRALKELINDFKIKDHLTGTYNINDFVDFGIHWFKGNTTLNNQPSGVVNGWLIVLNSELTVKQIWLRSGTPNTTDKEIYVRTYASNDGWSNWTPFHEEDTGWLNLSLKNNVKNYFSTLPAQYRKVGKVVYIRGALKNILSKDTTIAILPSEYRPSRTIQFIQNTSISGNSANYARWKITTSGEITIEGISSEVTASYGSDKWFSIDTSFLID